MGLVLNLIDRHVNCEKPDNAISNAAGFPIEGIGLRTPKARGVIDVYARLCHSEEKAVDLRLLEWSMELFSISGLSALRRQATT